MAWFFPFMSPEDRNRWRRDDDASANRPCVSNMRDAVSLADGRVDQLVRRQANGFSRARRGDAAAPVPDPLLQPLRVLGLRARFHRGSGRLAGAEGACVE